MSDLIPSRLRGLVGDRASRGRMASGLTALGLLVVMALVLLTPGLQPIEPGPSETEVALQAELARSADLKAQLEQAEDKLAAPRPVPMDQIEAERARGDDLARQLDAAEAKLMAPRKPSTELADAERARADDLGQQLDEAEARLMAPGEPPTDQAQRARADDLRDQLSAVEATLMAPRGLPTEQIEAERARADDLRGQLMAAEATLSAPRPMPTEQIDAERARSADLKNQVDKLTETLSKPRPDVPPVVTASLTRDEIAGSRNLFGLYTLQSPFDTSEFDLVENAVDRDAQVSGYFQSWEDDFRPDAVEKAWARDEIPLLTWESQAQVGVVSRDDATYSLPKIYGGDFDAYLTQYARDIVATDLPLVIRLNHEMNGNWYPWSEVDWEGKPVNGNNRGDYVKMWRHVHDIFEAEGANEYVVWLWAPNRVNRIPSQPAPAEFYPGDEYVDWIGISGYYRPYDEAATFDETYGRTLPLLREAAPDRPIFLAEIGATEDGQQKAAWIESLFEGLAANPDIIGFGWFSLAVTSGSDDTRSTNDWRVNSSGASQRALASGLAAYEFGRSREGP